MSAAEQGDALAEVRALILDEAALVRAIGSGRRRGAQARWRRVEFRYVDLRAGRRLQVTAYDEKLAHTGNPEDPAPVVDEMLAEPFANWHVETTTAVHQLRVTKKGRLLHHVTAREEPVERVLSHDREKERLLPSGHPVLRELGISDDRGRIKPSRQAKYRQVDEFLRALAASIEDAHGRLRTPTVEEPLRVVDLGCGNAYLTFAAQAWLELAGIPAVLTGVDVKEQSRRHNTEVAERLGIAGRTRFVVAGIGDVELPEPPEVVLALHACDTATDDALARAVEWDAAVVLAAPCCHHDVARQLRDHQPPPPYDLLARDGILRERLADTLTDGLRAALLRALGYRVDVVEFVDSRHTPRNTLLRAVRADASDRAAVEYADLVESWGLHPRLGELLGARLAGRSASR